MGKGFRKVIKASIGSNWLVSNDKGNMRLLIKKNDLILLTFHTHGKKANWLNFEINRERSSRKSIKMESFH